MHDVSLLIVGGDVTTGAHGRFASIHKAKVIEKDHTHLQKLAVAFPPKVLLTHRVWESIICAETATKETCALTEIHLQHPKLLLTCLFTLSTQTMANRSVEQIAGTTTAASSRCNANQCNQRKQVQTCVTSEGVDDCGCT